MPHHKSLFMRQCWAALKTIGVAKAFTCKTSFQNPSFMWPAWGLKPLFIFILMLFPVVSLFSTGCCSPAELPPMVNRKKEIHPELSCHEGTDSMPSSSSQRNVWSRGVCQKAQHLAGITEPRNVQVPCVKGLFVSPITHTALCRSLFPMDECDFLPSYQRQPIFRMSRWFTVRATSFPSA